MQTGSNGKLQPERRISDYKKLEEEHIAIEKQLHHVRKAESLGRMAGAIAHHFNNQLNVAALDLICIANINTNAFKKVNHIGIKFSIQQFCTQV
jgi:hypothetical protein